jgi:glycosyltransferase involved in cell wall biosynthesis
MKVLILLSYYNRPLLVRKALESVIASNAYHQNWHLVFGDDFSPINGEDILHWELRGYEERYEYINSWASVEHKLQHGLTIGSYANRAILRSDADIAVMLCDDDRLEPTYLRDLAKFYKHNPTVMYAYSNVKLYNPLLESSPAEDGGKFDCEGLVNPVNRLDASQVSFRLDAFRQGVRFPETTKTDAGPFIRNLDGELFQQLYDLYGTATPTGLVGQWKGIHDFQLVWHKKKGPDDFVKYVESVAELGGDRF